LQKYPEGKKRIQKVTEGYRKLQNNPEDKRIIKKVIEKL